MNRKWQFGKWICAKNMPKEYANSAPVFKAELFCSKQPCRAAIFLCSAGWHELYINGVKADDRLLTPSPMQYDKHLPYMEYDAAALLRPGKNQISVLTGNGFFNCGTENTWNFQHAVWRNQFPLSPQVRLLFECETEADMTFNATRTTTNREGQYMVTRTRHYLLHRGGHMAFEKVPVDGAKNMDDTMMESIEPFDYRMIEDFQIAYLAGFQAQRHDVSAEECQPRANERIRQSVRSLMQSTVMGYHTVVPTKTQIQLQNSRVKQVLMPVWLLNTRWKDQTYTFAMNGQTGQFIGDLPTDKGKFWKWLLGITGAVTAAAFAISYLLWLL